MNPVHYELMDVDSASIVGFYDTKEEALAIVRDAYERYGPAGIDDLILSEQSDQGHGTILGGGSELLQLAQDAPITQIVG